MMTTMIMRKKKQAERSCERWPVGCGFSRQFSRQDFLPRVHLLDAVEEASESPHLVGTWLKEIERAHRGEVAQNFQSVVNEMRDAQLLADTGLLVPLTTETNALAPDSGEVVEAVMVEPMQGLVLHALTALRDKKYLVAESLLHELAQGVEDARHCRSPQVIVSKERGIGSVVHSVDDDAADIDAKRFCIQRSVLLSRYVLT